MLIALVALLDATVLSAPELPGACRFPISLPSGSNNGQLIPPVLETPGSDPEAIAATYRATLTLWRSNCTKALNYTGKVYTVPELEWTQTSYIQPQIHPYDLFFYDPIALKFTVDKYLGDLRARYGGVDAILLWPTFPQVGLQNTPTILNVCVSPAWHRRP
jgi:hypothetical protein